MTAREAIAWLAEQGLSPEIVSQNRHVKVRITLPNGSQENVTIPSSGSDRRNRENMMAYVRRRVKGAKG